MTKREMANHRTAFDLAWRCLRLVRSLQLLVRYHKALLRGPWAFAGAAVPHAAWERALELSVRQGVKRRVARDPRPEPAQLRRLADLLGAPAALPDSSQRAVIASMLRD